MRSLRTLKKKKMSRIYLLKIRVSPEERDAVKATADDVSLTVLDYVRMRLAHHVVCQTATERDTLTHLTRRIGSDIIKIARLANTYANPIEGLEIILTGRHERLPQQEKGKHVKRLSIFHKIKSKP